MGLKLSRTRPGRDPDEALLGLKSIRTNNGVKIEPDETLLGLKSIWTRNGVKIEPDEKWRTGHGVKISSGNAGFERAVLPGACKYNCNNYLSKCLS